MQDLPPKPMISSHLQRKLDAICDAFEKRWENGESPSIDEYCKFAVGEFRDQLFLELTIVAHQLSERAKNSATSSTNSTQPNSIRPNLSVSNETRTGALKTAKMQFPTPARIGLFEIRYELGRGSAGAVYEAIDTRDGAQVAVKVPHAYLISTQEGMGRFLAEAKHAQLLQHPNVVKLIYFGEDGPGPFLAYEFLNGVDLKNCIKLGVELPLNLKLEIIRQAARGLQGAHESGVIHRDVSPGNIMVTIPEGQDLYHALESQCVSVKVIDFGIARPVDAETLQTRTGAMMGTPAYMSPEQASGLSKEVDVRSDIYGLGAVMYHLLTSSLPFSGNVESLLNQRRSQEVPLLSSTHPSLPTPVSTICQRCLRLSPEDRYASMRLLVSDIENFLSGKPIQAKPVGFLEHYSSIWKHNLKVRAASGFALLLVASVAFTAYAASTYLANKPSQGVLKGQVDRTATRQFIDALPGSIADPESLAKSISTATPEELVKLVEALKSHSSSSSNQWDAFFDKVVSNDSKETIWEIRLEKLNCVRCALEPSRFATLAKPQDFIRWIAGLVKNEDLPSWQALIKPYEAQFFAFLPTIYDKETLPSVRNGLAILLANSHNKDPEKLLDYAVRSQPAELAVWGEAIGRFTSSPSESILVDWQNFDDPNRAEGLSETYCTEQANRVLIRLIMGDTECLRLALKQRPDPRLRTYVVHRLVATEVKLDGVLQQLLVEKEHDVCYGLLLVLGLMDGNSVAKALKNQCKEWLVENYQHHPDSGVHAMCRILLDRWQWNQELRKLDESLLVTDSPGKSDKNWFVNTLGMHFAIIRAPVDFWMGQERDLRIGFEFNPKHLEHIDHSYAIALDQTDINSVNRFVDQQTRVGGNWDSSIDFCRWLNQHEGFDDFDVSIFADAGHTEEIKKFIGYRLPLSSEWEYAAKGIVSTSCHFGSVKTDHSSTFRRKREDQFVPFPNRTGLTGLCDYLEPSCTPYTHDPKCILMRGGHIMSSVLSRTELTVSPHGKIGISNNYRIRPVLVLPAYLYTKDVLK